MIIFGLIIWPVIALLGLLALYACTGRQPGRAVLPAVRTVALIAAACAIVAATFR